MKREFFNIEFYVKLAIAKYPTILHAYTWSRGIESEKKKRFSSFSDHNNSEAREAGGFLAQT